MDYECDGDTDCNWCTWNNPQNIDKRPGKLGNKRTRGDHLDYNIF